MTSLVALRNFFESEVKIPMFLASLGAGSAIAFMGQILTGFVHAFAWRGSFFLVACLVLQICVMAMILPIREKNSSSIELLKGPAIQWSIFNNLRYMLFLAVVFFQSCTMGMLFILLLDYGKQMEFTEWESTFILTFVGILGLPGRGLGAILIRIDKFSSLITLCLASTIFGGGVLFLKYSSSFGFALVFAFFIGIAVGIFFFVMWMVPMDMFSKEEYSTATGFAAIGVGLGNLLSAPLAGKLISLGKPWHVFLRVMCANLLSLFTSTVKFASKC